MVDANAPIGIIDSGVGGLTVARAILDQLPHEPIRYIGDTARGPYGPLPLPTVRDYALELMDGLVHDDGVKALVIACNTASAACFHIARDRYPGIPVVEVIEPAVRRAVLATRSGIVGVIGTVGTIDSRAYDEAFAELAPQLHVHSAACPAFVDFVERGQTYGRQVLNMAQIYLDPLMTAGIDTLVLGCTHYPLLTALISNVVGDGVTLISSAEETAKDLYRQLAARDAFRDEDAPPPVHRFLATGDPAPFATLGRRFLGPEVQHVESRQLPIESSAR
ncbi:MAG: glutamate racemase [Frankiaceae bacterium]|nr:glutamate racemase [Frankiaceae bacterium]MDQ1715523.1 glutamate racemase [Frankiaceae bacterium]